jgi:hypothetical protein
MYLEIHVEELVGTNNIGSWTALEKSTVAVYRPRSANNEDTRAIDCCHISGFFQPFFAIILDDTQAINP